MRKHRLHSLHRCMDVNPLRNSFSASELFVIGYLIGLV